MITFTTGNPLDTEVHARVNAVNTVGVSGKSGCESGEQATIFDCLSTARVTPITAGKTSR